MSGAVRYGATKNMDVGWRVALRRHGDQDLDMAGRLVTVGPMWACVARRRGRLAALRIEINPWVAVNTTLVAPPANPDDPLATSKPIRLRFGADASALLHASLRLGKTWRFSPGVGVVGTVARATNLADTDKKKPWLWDKQTGWRIALPMWFGAQQRFRVEGGYTGSFHEGMYLRLVHERWDLALAWTF
jgi:hypothetical protein